MKTSNMIRIWSIIRIEKQKEKLKLETEMNGNERNRIMKKKKLERSIPNIIRSAEKYVNFWMKWMKNVVIAYWLQPQTIFFFCWFSAPQHNHVQCYFDFIPSAPENNKKKTAFVGCCLYCYSLCLRSSWPIRKWLVNWNKWNKNDSASGWIRAVAYINSHIVLLSMVVCSRKKNCLSSIPGLCGPVSWLQN